MISQINDFAIECYRLTHPIINAMKFAVCNELFEAWNTERGFDFPRVFDYIKRCGYTGIEIAPFTLGDQVSHISAAQRKEIRRCAEQCGLEISGLHWLLAQTQGYHLTSPSLIVRQQTAGYFLELIRLCADLGGHFMVFGSPQQRNILPEISEEQAFDYAAGVLEKLVPALEQYNVQMALEPLAPTETNFITSAAEAVRLIKRVGASQQIALHLDCKAMSSEKRPIPELIRANKEHLIYFHLNDPNLSGPGLGHLDFVPIMRALLDINYTGWASVETFDYSAGIKVIAEKSLVYSKKCLEEASKMPN